MSLDIDQIALHQLIKRDEQNLELVLRESLLEPTATVVEMMAELHRVYSAKNKAYGLFNEESELAQALRGQRKGEEAFLPFSPRRYRAPARRTGKISLCRRRYCAVLPVSLSGGGISDGGGAEQPKQHARQRRAGYQLHPLSGHQSRGYRRAY